MERDVTRILTHLERLEAEAIHIMREVMADAQKPVMMYSVGKDSAVLLHLAKKAFYPSSPPFPLLHVDTTWKFRDMYALREKAAAEAGMELIVHHNAEAKERGINPTMHILDNKTSGIFKKATKNNRMKHQLVPLDDHRRNTAEKVIQISKDHFVSVLCGTDTAFPVCLWCRILRQAEHQLNLL